ncbi:AAA family ATPase [Devosia sp.]|uniref:AAA family ATPase n=1 Tax=Devosia sp. TaxID=1871048 RepID=UPI003F6F391B
MKPLQRDSGTLIPLETIPAVPESGFWRTHGPALVAQGYGMLVPLDHGTKKAAPPRWTVTDFNTDRDLRRCYHGCGVGIKTGTVVGIDVDCDDHQVVEQFIAWCEQHLGRPLRRDGRRGTMLLYRTSKPRRYSPSHAYRAPGHERPQRLEVLGVGRQVAVYIEDGDSGQPYYRYPNGELTDRPMEELTEISEQQIFAAVDHFDGLARGTIGWTQVVSAEGDRADGEHKPGKDPHAPLWLLKAALAVIPTPPGWEAWNHICLALFRATDGSEDGFELFDGWSQRGVGYDGGGPARERWEDMASSPPDRIGAGTILHMANEAAPGWRRQAEADRDATHPGWRERDQAEKHERLRQGLESVRREGAGEDEAAEGHREPPLLSVRGLTTWLASQVVAAKLPRREFLLGRTFARTFVGSVFAEGGTGKTTLVIAQALAMSSGRDLTGEKVHQRCRALLICFEDDADELNRRVAAAMIHHKIEPGDVEDRLHLGVLNRSDGKLMVIDPETRQPIPGPLAPSLEELITKIQADVVILDPLKKIHGVEENNNDHMDAVAQVLTDMASKLNIAISVPHHMTKGAADPGNADRGRGASALKDALRLGFTMTHMSAAEAERFGIPEDERKTYVRVDPAKVNIVPHARAAQWFRLVNVEIGNGDSVQAIEPWQPPQLMEGLDDEAVDRILAEIKRGIDDGERYSSAPSATSRCVSKAFERASTPKSASDARMIVSEWIKKGKVRVAKYQSPNTRRPLQGLFVTDRVAAEQGAAGAQSDTEKSAQ